MDYIHRAQIVFGNAGESKLRFENLLLNQNKLWILL
jgi:hypothetical protein